MNELTEVVQQWVSLGLMWIGFGTVVGLLAKAIMPGRDPGGAVANLVIGIVGSIIGPAALMFFWDGARVTPMSPLGFALAIAGAFLLLAAYRLLAGKIFREGDTPLHPRHRTRRYVSVAGDE